MLCQSRVGDPGTKNESIFGLQKDDPPGGTTGRVGVRHGVDEAPVPDVDLPRFESEGLRLGRSQ
jgi:hypothetical protein